MNRTKIHTKTKHWLLTVMHSISLNPTLLLSQTLHYCSHRERTLVRVVWNLGSLRLLELRRITPNMPVGCTPFLSSLHFFHFLTPPFAFSCFPSQAHFNCFSNSAAPHDISSFSVLPFFLPYLSLSVSSPVSLRLRYLSVKIILWGFLKGHRGEETFCSTCLSDVVQSKKSVKTTQKGRRRQRRRLKGNRCVKLTILKLK